VPGIFSYERRSSAPVTLNGSDNVMTIMCSAGKRVLGGGYSASNNQVTASMSGPTPSNDGWQVNLRENVSGNPTAAVYVICANIGS
jgi:hypothetical protein